jgi:hypothetical protein
MSFASRSIAAHLGRGLAGIAAITAAFVMADSHPLGSLVTLAAALLAFRGCPTCWTLGLIETVVARVRGRPAPSACLDGRCALPRRGPP